jgi:hypothetical protein
MLNMNAIATPPSPDDDKNGTHQFKKGTSGNPTGRPRGSLNKSTLMMKQLLEDQGEELLKKEIALALKGDRHARRFCLDRMFPSSKDRPIELELPPAENLQQVAVALSSVLQAVGTGQITPVAGVQVGNLLHLQNEVLKHADFERRILLLEQVFDPELEAAREKETQDRLLEAYKSSDEIFRRHGIK